MRIKVKPEDFIVREKSLLRHKQEPDAYRIYRLVKRQWETFDLIDLLARRLRIPKSDIAVSGIKDRYGDTDQFVSIKNSAGLPVRFEEKNFSLSHAGYAEEKLAARHIEGNFFTIVLRDIPYYQLDLFLANAAEVKEQGFPNYFDEQRFGSARAGAGFMGKALFAGNMEEALRIYCAPSRHDRREEKTFKREMSEHWRKWEKVSAPAPRRYLGILEILTSEGKRTAFTRAVNAIDRDILLLALQGYQSYLFNRLVVHLFWGLEQTTDAGPFSRLAFKYGELLFYRTLPVSLFERLRSLLLPVPGHDTETVDPLVKAAFEKTLEEEKIGLVDLKVRKLHGKAVRGTMRPLIVIPENFTVGPPEQDDCYPGRYQLRLEFFLPRGSYATMLVKRIALGTR